MRIIVFCSLLLCLAPDPALSQESARPPEWPPSEDLVQQFLNGDQGIIVSTGVGTCPDRNPYGDSIWVALLEAPPTDALVARLAPAWSHVLRRCGDQRIADWYTARMRESEHVLTAGALLYPLRNHGTPEIIAFLKELAMEPSRPAPLRSTILDALAERSSVEKRVDLYIEVLQRPEAIPDPYELEESWFLVRSTVAEPFVTRALAVIAQGRGGSSAARVLGYFTGYQPILDSPTLRARLAGTADEILRQPGGPYPHRLVEAARRTAEKLKRPRG